MKKLKVFIGGPFSVLIEDGKKFDSNIKHNFLSLIEYFKSKKVEIFSAHEAEDFGEGEVPADIVTRDHLWVASCDLYVAYLPSDNNVLIRTDGTFAEIGAAFHARKPIIIIGSKKSFDKASWYLKKLLNMTSVHLIDEESDFSRVFKKIDKGLIEIVEKNFPDKNDVLNLIHIMDVKTEDSEVIFDDGSVLIAPPSVLSPSESRSGFLLSKNWSLKSGDIVLDIGCGSGILTIEALKQGASFVMAVDINPEACRATKVNAERLGFGKKVKIIESNLFEAVSGKFDIIVSNPPYWNEIPKSFIERNFFDPNFEFLSELFRNGQNFLNQNGRISIINSDVVDINSTLKLINNNPWKLEDMKIIHPNWPRNYNRIIWNGIML